MTSEESLRENGYSIIRSNLSKWKKSTFTSIENGTLIFCLEGSAIIEVNMIEYHVEHNSYLCIPGNSLVKLISYSDNFATIRINYTQEAILAATIGLNLDTRQNIFRYPHNKTNNDREVCVVLNILSTLEEYAQMPRYAHHSELSCGLIRCLIIVIAGISANNNQTKTQATVYTTSDTYFMNFIGLLNKYSKIQHDVAFYADKLNITPKYLNEIARKKVNHTAKDVITKFIIAQLKRELLISGNSVQRIAYDFNFCDQSSLGKFFKKATGMSPVNYRKTPQ